MSILGEQFEPWVQEQIKARQELRGLKQRNNEHLSVLNNQSAWLKLGSSVKILDDGIGRERLKDIGISNPSQFIGTKLAEKSILFNTLSELNTSTSKYTQRAGVTDNTSLWNSSNAYGLGGNQFGITPPPGLISADIKAKNRGSIREANIVLKANNKFQFELIELLYLRLGFSMLLEWGWNKYLSSDPDKTAGEFKTTTSTLMETFWFNDKTLPFTDVLKKIDQQRLMLEGNYDGFLGKVVNFDWKFNPDGTYDITLKLITVGDVIESLKLNLPQTTATVGQIKDSINKNVTPVSSGLTSAGSTIITNAGDSTLSYDLYSDIIGDPDKFDGSQGGKKTGFLSLLGVVGEEINSVTSVNPEAGSPAVIPLTPSTTQGGNTMKYSFYLTFQELLSKIERFVLPTINGDKILGINMSEDQICAIYPYQFSMDPRVCFVKPFFLDEYSYNTEEAFKTSKTSGGNLSGTGISNYYTWLNRVNNFGDKDKDCIFGNIMNIYLNYNFVTDTLANETNDKGDIYLFKFLQKICDGINDAMGGINNIECILTKDRVIEFIEQNPIPSIESSTRFSSYFKRDPVPFELYGNNPSGTAGKQTSNFVRDFGFNTKIDPQLASMITIGATAEGKKTKNYDGTAFSKWNDGLQDRFSYKFDSPEEPPFVPPPSGSAGGGIYPLTLEQVSSIEKHFKDKGEIDKYYGIITRDQIDTTFAGITLNGIKDIPKHPLLGRSYNNSTWAEFGNAVRLKVALTNSKNSATIEETKDDIVNYIAYCVRAFGGKELNVVNAAPDYFKMDEGFIKLGKNSFKGWVNIISNKIFEKEKQPSNTIGFIPIDLNLKCDGLSGVKIYNQLAIRQEFLPKQYPKALKFLISQVNHSISGNDWTTELKTISTANTRDTKLTKSTLTLVEYDLSDKELIYAASTFGSPGNLTIIPGIGGIAGSNITGDPAKIINPNDIGSSAYSRSPLAKWYTSKGITNGINAQILSTLTDTGEPGSEKNRLHNGGNPNWMLASPAASSWARWKADAASSGYKIRITNGYRSQEFQASFGAGSGAASPGKSAHGWGGAVDVNIKETNSNKLRHRDIRRTDDYDKARFKYGGGWLDNKTGAGAQNDRMTEDWKVVALLGARYGFYNPERLADNTSTPEKLASRLDEAWHFEYWGPVEVGYTNTAAVAGGGSVSGATGTGPEQESYNNLKALATDIDKIFRMTDNFGKEGKPLFDEFASGFGDDEAGAAVAFEAWLQTSSIKKRALKLLSPDSTTFNDSLNEILIQMQESVSNVVYITATIGTPSGKKETVTRIITNFG